MSFLGILLRIGEVAIGVILFSRPQNLQFQASNVYWQYGLPCHASSSTCDFRGLGRKHWKTKHPTFPHTHTHAPDCAGTSLRIPLGNMEQLGLLSIHWVTWWGVIFPLKVLILDQAPHHTFIFNMLARFLQCRGAACSVLGVCMKGSKVSKIGYRQ